MKKLILILFIFISVLSFGQTSKQSITWLRVEDITNTRYFIWQGDTIDFEGIKEPITSIELQDDYLKFYRGEDILDSVLWDYTQTVDTFKIEGDSILLKITDDDLQYLDVSSFSSKLDTVTHNSTLVGQGTIDSPLKVDSTIISSIMQNIYSISLPSASTVAGRCSGAVEGTDYPTGWTLEAGSNPVDLKVTHGLERRVVNVTIFSVNGDEERQLFDNAAYSGIITLSNNILRIESLATIQKEIAIYIVFE
jgi:hypothetical protein